MGKNNRERRAAKCRRQRASRPGPPRHSQHGRAGRSHGGFDPPATVEELAWQAVGLWRADEVRYRGLLDVLEERGQPALAILERMLGQAVATLWQRGWTAVEAVHVTKRLLSEPHAHVVAAAALEDLRARGDRGALHPGWAAQVAVLSERAGGYSPSLDVVLLVAVLAVVSRLPDVPSTIPAPADSPAVAGLASARLDERMLARVRALLVKAESTDFPEEAEALTAKAQALIARHAIDEALLESGHDNATPTMRRVLLDDPYADAKASLVTAVALANRCRVVQSPAFGWCTVFGFGGDLDAVELLVASLLAQATRTMARHGPRRDPSGRSTTRSFRRSFLLGFSQRIGQRLGEATATQVTEAQAEHGRLLPVLASRDEHVRAAEQAMFPQAVKRSTSVSNASGWTAGQAAADLAELSVGARLLDSS